MQIRILGWAKLAIASLALAGPALGIIYEAGRYADSIDRAVVSLSQSEERHDHEIHSIEEQQKSLEEQIIREQDALREVLRFDGLDTPMKMEKKSQVNIPPAVTENKPHTAVPNNFESILGGLK